MGGKPRQKPVRLPPRMMGGSKRKDQFFIVKMNNSQTFAFVQHPDSPGYFMKVDISVALVPCHSCNVAKGVPCRGRYGGYTVGTDVDRKIAAARLRKTIKRDKGFILTASDRVIFARDL